MTTLDELWAWIYSPLHELVAERAGDRDKSWTDLRAHFLERAELQESSDNSFVDDLLTQLDELPDSDREALLDSNDQLEGFAYATAERHAGDSAGAADAATTETAAGYDEPAWQQYLMENGAQWNGDEESWEQFKDWLLYYADEKGFAEPATALLSYLDSQPAEDRIATLAQYGVIINQPQPAADVPVIDDSGTENIRAVLGDDPMFADLSEDQLRQMFIEVRDAMGAE
jgi:hypothetical protein